MHHMQASARVELGVLQTLGWVQLAVGAAGVVEDLGEHPDNMVVVVEHLGVIAPVARVPFGKDGIRGVDHDFPDVRVGQQRLEGAVAHQVAQGPFHRCLGVGDVERPAPLAVFLPPAGHLLIEQQPQPVSVTQLSSPTLNRRSKPLSDSSRRCDDHDRVSWRRNHRSPPSTPTQDAALAPYRSVQD
jgi:hypothetical protein